MRTFESLTEQEILAVAISLEEDDARIYEDFADGLKESYPEQAAKFLELQKEEDGHRHRLLDHYKGRFGDHVPLIRRENVRVVRDRGARCGWCVRWRLKAVQKQAELMEVETRRRFYEGSGKTHHRCRDPAIARRPGGGGIESRPQGGTHGLDTRERG